MTLLALALGAVAVAAAPDRDAPVPRPGLTLPAPAVLGPNAQLGSLGAAFHGNYPALAVAFAEGMPAGLELAGAGRFEHARVSWPGADGRADADEFQAALRWGAPLGSNRAEARVAVALGFTAGYARTAFADGRYAFSRDRTRWAELAAGAGGLAGARATLAERFVRDLVARRDVHATVLGLESPGWNGASLLAELGILLANPLRWKTPWAAGIRFPAGGQALDVFVSNVRGVTVPGSLEGGRDLVWAFRLLVSM